MNILFKSLKSEKVKDYIRKFIPPILYDIKKAFMACNPLPDYERTERVCL
jgi:hypothetical protein